MTPRPLRAACLWTDARKLPFEPGLKSEIHWHWSRKLLLRKSQKWSSKPTKDKEGGIISHTALCPKHKSLSSSLFSRAAGLPGSKRGDPSQHQAPRAPATWLSREPKPKSNLDWLSNPLNSFYVSTLSVYQVPADIKSKRKKRRFPSPPRSSWRGWLFLYMVSTENVFTWNIQTDR